MSVPYGGCASDRHIVQDSGFLDNISPTDQVMADRGFPIQSDLVVRQVFVDYTTTSARNRADDKGKCTENKISCESSHPCRASHWTDQVVSYSEQMMPLTLVPLANEIPG